MRGITIPAVHDGKDLRSLRLSHQAMLSLDEPIAQELIKITESHLYDELSDQDFQNFVDAKTKKLAQLLSIDRGFHSRAYLYVECVVIDVIRRQLEEAHALLRSSGRVAQAGIVTGLRLQLRKLDSKIARPRVEYSLLKESSKSTVYDGSWS